MVLLDGLFGGSTALTPTECRELLGAGWTTVGTSRGALRAADLWPPGAIGDVFTLYRPGAPASDADAATLPGSDADHTELTVFIVHLRAVLAAATGSGVLAPAVRTAMSRAAEGVHWTERSWPACAGRPRAWSGRRWSRAVWWPQGGARRPGQWAGWSSCSTRWNIRWSRHCPLMCR
ncbi:TfuA-like protein [Streptomyces sp. NPDC001709]